MPELSYEIYNKNKINFPILFCCDHANNKIPNKFKNLDLKTTILESHIGYDIGAKSLAINLANHFNTTAIVGKYSRLLVDLNRSPKHKDVVSEISDGIKIAGNINLNISEFKNRIKRFHQPYHEVISQILNEMDKKHSHQTSLICIHSFTPKLKNHNRRIWDIGLLHRDDKRLLVPIRKFLKYNNNLIVADNLPYSGYDDVNYTMTKHGELDGRPFISIEIRNDLINNLSNKNYSKIFHSLTFAINNSYREIEKNLI